MAGSPRKRVSGPSLVCLTVLFFSGNSKSLYASRATSMANLGDKYDREYYQQTSSLGRTIWEILLQGLGYSTDVMDAFARRPLVQMKLIRYPAPKSTLPGQYGVGAHNDFGGVTVLLQQPGKEGLEVWLEDEQAWLSVPAREDTYVINCGDMIMKWSRGRYKSVKHRVINKSDAERLSCATFWHGDVFATNPLDPNDESKETVGQLLVRRFRNQMSLPKAGLAQVGEA